MALILAVLLMGVGYPQWYEIQPDELVIRNGLLRRRVPYTEMVGLERIYSPRRTEECSVAVSIQLRTGHYLRLSPKDISGFVSHLSSRAPKMAVEPAAED